MDKAKAMLMHAETALEGARAYLKMGKPDTALAIIENAQADLAEVSAGNIDFRELPDWAKQSRRARA